MIAVEGRAAARHGGHRGGGLGVIAVEGRAAARHGGHRGGGLGVIAVEGRAADQAAAVRNAAKTGDAGTGCRA